MVDRPPLRATPDPAVPDPPRRGGVVPAPASPRDATQADDGTSPDEAPLDPGASAVLIAEQRARVAEATDVDGRLLFGLWGLAWLIGFGALYAVSGDRPLVDAEPGGAVALFTVILLAAMVVTAVHVGRRTSGIHGDSAVQGAMYGWSWFLGFGGMFALASALAGAGAEPEVIQTAMTIGPPVLVGVLYMAGAAIWQDRTQFALGAWILVVTMVAAFVGLPGMLAVMALAGGGGMLAGAVAVGMRRRRYGARRPVGTAGLP